jgi:hypothetical protein
MEVGFMRTFKGGRWIVLAFLAIAVARLLLGNGLLR